MQILEVKLCDATGARIRLYDRRRDGGADLYRAESLVADPVFGIAIHHQNGVHLCGPNTECHSGLPHALKERR